MPNLISVWVMEILNIYREEQFLAKYYMIKHLEFASNPRYDDHQRGLASMC